MIEIATYHIETKNPTFYTTINNWVMEVGQNAKPCEICGENYWLVQNPPYSILQMTKGNLVIGAGTIHMPVLVLICDKCVNLRFLSAKKMEKFIPKKQTTERLGILT